MLIRIALLLLALSYNSKAENNYQLDCKDLSPEDCKARFKTIFESGFRSLNVEVAEKPLNVIKNLCNAILKDLPTQGRHTEEFRKLLNTQNELSKKVEQAQEDPVKVFRVMFEMTRTITLPLGDLYELDTEYLKAEDFKKIIQKHKFENAYLGGINDTDDYVDGLEKIFQRPYASLRAIDFKKYPKYKDLNENVELLKTGKGDPYISMLLTGAMDNILDFFGMQSWSDMMAKAQEEEK